MNKCYQLIGVPASGKSTWDEQKIMLDLGFVHAQEGDADNIPDQPVEEGVEQ